jgi:HPt (histidine-containing phosphotransfer) domain-containing protein
MIDFVMTTDTEIFDYPSLAHLLQDDEQLIKTILSSFVKDYVVQYDSLRQALENNDVESSQKLSHKIKGASANVRAIEIHSITTDMDAAGKAGNIEAIREKLADLDVAFERFCDSCRAYIDD